ncbi:hypothetical protein [Orenia marismortui]|uniref:hypothetical protein n=1 Tax=Orenia marismortui TaxID=46469 RepID=UPI0003665300|nr:hypothetical protein [Orenia marismortui]
MKRYLVILFMVLVVIFTYNFSTKAKGIIDSNKLELDLMINYSNYVYKTYGDNVEEDNYIREDLHHGKGYLGEIIYWVNNRFGVGLGLESNRMVSEWCDNLEKYKYSSQLEGPYAKMIYNLNDNIRLYNNIINYRYKEHYQKAGFDNDLIRGNGIGVLLGMKVDYPINNNLSVILDSGYRIVRIKIKKRYSSKKDELIKNKDGEKIKISGLRVGLSVAYRF